jgi:hypothetical protein
MFKDFFNAICRIGVFMVCAQAIVHFRPDKKYDKYLKYLMSVMVLIQIFIPIISLFSSGELKDMEERVKWFEQQLRESEGRVGEARRRSDEILSRMTLDEIRSFFGTGVAEEVMEKEVMEKEEAAEEGMGEEAAGEDSRTPFIDIEHITIEGIEIKAQ